MTEKHCGNCRYHRLNGSCREWESILSQSIGGNVLVYTEYERGENCPHFSCKPPEFGTLGEAVKEELIEAVQIIYVLCNKALGPYCKTGKRGEKPDITEDQWYSVVGRVWVKCKTSSEPATLSWGMFLDDFARGKRTQALYDAMQKAMGEMKTPLTPK